MLDVKDITVSYKGIMALQDVSLNVEKKQIVAILGSNGAGKSTLMKAISGLVFVNNGKIFFKGEDITNIDSYKIVRKGISQSPEGRHILKSLSVYDNLILGAYVRRKRNQKELGDSLEYVYKIFPILKDRKGMLAAVLSGGEQQMLAIGRALMSKPIILLLDEPSQD